MNWWNRIAQYSQKQLEQELTRREAIEKLTQLMGMVVGSSTFAPDFLKALSMLLGQSNHLHLLQGSQPPLIESSHATSIQEENRKPGTNNWKISIPGKHLLQGYASALSVRPGNWLTFYVSSQKPYRMEIYRMGWYGGKGGRLVEKIEGFPPVSQPSTPDPETMDAGWKPTHAIRIPDHWTTGFYLNKLVDEEGRQSYIPFVVRQSVPHADFAVLIATNTYHAYNAWGGKSLYSYNSTEGIQSSKVSFNRPFDDFFGAGQFFKFEYNLIRWLEKKGYSLTYLTDLDVHLGLLEKAQVKALIIAGHSEYWSMQMRNSIETLTNNRINLAVFGANVGYWQVRFEPDKEGRPNRVMVSYKQNADRDPYYYIHPELVTTRFRDKPVSKPEDQVFGIMYCGIPDHTASLVVADPNHWIYEGTGLRKGDKIPGVVGGEIDRYCGKIPGVQVIAHSPAYCYGKPNYANVVWYPKPGGKAAFATGTFYWSWFLDPFGHTAQAAYNAKIERMTTNVLERLKQS
ncbi:N,N-dimethylformamidase beta subunit family domain-containing protein [Polycladomyces subterraneus]|uniref:N,N-dimethylformamidase beta subunit-like C-terminal domain-containing protein n=1 Tax=Polycladomyces subterraneus TaxID=1016997 RepID=A0ABT8ILH8_9BACL|nr:N,N-dimethylformamidase beta subunit family domain-containing protein [Polycladomyces subterraneus]MDN4593645.1 hypothetical protein [Polycladomyces subterraneus]